MNFIIIEKFSDKATVPTRGSSRSAGYDLYSAKDYVIKKSNRVVVETNIAIELPEGCYGRIAGRSGLAAKYGIQVGAGVIDPDYRGCISIVLFNHGETDFFIKTGDRIAQIIPEKYMRNTAMVEGFNLSKTKRGVSGFGSTGVSNETKEEMNYETDEAEFEDNYNEADYKSDL